MCLRCHCFHRSFVFRLRAGSNSEKTALAKGVKHLNQALLMKRAFEKCLLLRLTASCQRDFPTRNLQVPEDEAAEHDGKLRRHGSRHQTRRSAAACAFTTTWFLVILSLCARSRWRRLFVCGQRARRHEATRGDKLAENCASWLINTRYALRRCDWSRKSRRLRTFPSRRCCSTPRVSIGKPSHRIM